MLSLVQFIAVHLGPCRTGRAGRPRGEYILERDVVTRYLESCGSEFFAGNLVEIWRGSRENWRRARQKRERERERELQTGSGTMKNSKARCDGMAELVPQTERAGGGGRWTMEVATCSNYPAALWPSGAGDETSIQWEEQGPFSPQHSDHTRHTKDSKIEDIGRTRDAADWQKLPDAKACKGVVFTRGFSRRHCTRHLDSIPPSKPTSLISTGWRRCYIRRTLQGGRSLGQLVCVGVTAESGDGGGEGKGEVPQVPSMAVCVQPWHDALLKIGNALIMMFWWMIRARQFDPEPFPHASSPHHLSLGSGSWGLGPRWRSFNPLGIAAISRNAPKKQLLMVTTDSVKNRMVSSIGGSRRIYPHCLVCGTRRGCGHGTPLTLGVKSLFPIITVGTPFPPIIVLDRADHSSLEPLSGMSSAIP